MAKFARKLKRSLNGTDINTALNSGTTLSNYKKTMRKQHKLEQRMEKIMRYQPSVSQNYNDNYSSDLLNIANGTPDYIIKHDNDNETTVNEYTVETSTINKDNNNFKSAPSLPAINDIIANQSALLNDQLDNSNEQVL